MFFQSLHVRIRTVLLCIFLALLITLPVLGTPPITKIDLGVDILTLEVGESYSFRVTYEPENPRYHALKWSVSDNSILEIDPVHFTVTALKAGTARILAESLDGFSYDICTVTVSGNLPKDVGAAKSGGSFLTLSAEDRSKITSFSITRYLDFLEGSTLTDDAFADASRR